MHWYEKQSVDQAQATNNRRGPTPVDGIADIPMEATPRQTFRLVVEVTKVYERSTKTGDPCFFLSCRDSKGKSFSVVVWNTQMESLQDELEERAKMTLDVRVPKDGFTAFTLA